jgi:hypothetical protein
MFFWGKNRKGRDTRGNFVKVKGKEDGDKMKGK